jgi:hypothetical protein
VRSDPWQALAPSPELPAIGMCSYCIGRYLAYQSGANANGRPLFMCSDCAAARGFSFAPLRLGEKQPPRKPPAREIRAKAAKAGAR